MELFRETKIDWLSKAKYFFALSVLLLVAGGSSLVSRGGPDYGIDFKGGTIVYVRFAGPPPVDQLRSGLVREGMGQSVIQPIGDIADPNSNEVMISIEQQGEGAEALDAGKTAIQKALSATLGSGEAGKQDFNAVGPAAIAEHLTRQDPLGAGAEAATRYGQLARQVTQFRDRDRRGLVTNLDDLAGAGIAPQVIAALREGFYTSNFAIINVEIVGPKVGADLRRQAIWVTLYALGGMLVYIALRFEWIYGAAAVLAVFHDVLITLGLFSIFRFEISLTVIAALLTLVGYSMNDTIVIFDRIRENLRLMRREPFAVIVNRSINQTLSRTVLTSGLTFLTVLVLFVMGGQVLRAFSFALVVGIVVGTYSSFGLAAPLLALWIQWRGQGVAAVVPGTATGKKLRKS